MLKHVLGPLLLFVMALPLQAQGVAFASEAGNLTNDGAGTILERYAAAWRGREEISLDHEVTLGFRIAGPEGGEYHIVLGPEGPGRLGSGIPEGNVVFETDIEFLRRLDRGEINALTAMGQARGSDPIPLMPRFPTDFRWTPEARSFYFPLFFSFWNREWPHVVRFGEGTTREIHGANATALYYDAGLRSAWYQLKPGMHINADPNDQSNPFTSLIIATRGAVLARLGGVELTLAEGDAVVIPAGMRHEFWVNEGGYGEAVVVMFGEGS
jgi:mannose-6-phosphate isomerase-like protein (cupin superfamily)